MRLVGCHIVLRLVFAFFVLFMCITGIDVCVGCCVYASDSFESTTGLGYTFILISMMI